MKKKDDKKKSGQNTSSAGYKPRECPKSFKKKCPKEHDPCFEPGQEASICAPTGKDFKEAERPKPSRCPDDVDPCPPPAPPPPAPPYNPDICPPIDPTTGPCARFNKTKSAENAPPLRDCNGSDDKGPCGQ